MNNLVEVENLRVTFKGAQGQAAAVRGISFTIGHERVGIVGESGSGKSLTARSLPRLLPSNAKASADVLRFQGRDLMSMGSRDIRRVRGAGISFVMQDPRYSLNPALQVGLQVEEAYRLHRKTSRRDARQRTLDMLEAVQITDPERVYCLYPHQISGGMGQRIMIAMMLIPEPDLLIADEPTSALDVTVQRSILTMLEQLIERRNMALLLISHDIDLVSSFCDRVLIMYRGQIVETCRADDLASVTHPYSKGLLASVPCIGDVRTCLPVLQRDAAWSQDLEAGQ